MTDRRAALLLRVASAIDTIPDDQIRRVAVDGVDGAGKSTFAAALIEALARAGIPATGVSFDDFVHPRAVRYRKGRDSPDGYFEDTYDDASIRSVLLDPLGPGGNRTFRRAVRDVVTDRPVAAPAETLRPPAVLVVDGLFLHRPDLRDDWDLSIFLDVDHATAYRRMAERDGADPDPGAPANRRHVGGQQRYLRECQPAERADIVIDNRDYCAPAVLAWRWPT